MRNLEFHYSKLVLNFVLLVFLVRTLIVFFWSYNILLYVFNSVFIVPMTFYRIDVVTHLAGWKYCMNLLTVQLASVLFYREARLPGNKEWWFSLFFEVDRHWQHCSSNCNSLRNWVRLIPAGTLLVSWSTAEQTLQMECRLPCVCCQPVDSFFFQHEINGLMLMTGATLMMLKVTLSTHSEEQW